MYDWIKYEPHINKLQLLTIQMPIKITEKIKNYFEVLEVYYNESDQHYNKKILKAIKPSFDKRPGSTTNFNLVL